jgi:ABC-type transport system involved in multi-copper enzyme maturation permease subunit
MKSYLSHFFGSAIISIATMLGMIVSGSIYDAINRGNDFLDQIQKSLLSVWANPIRNLLYFVLFFSISWFFFKKDPKEDISNH